MDDGSTYQTMEATLMLCKNPRSHKKYELYYFQAKTDLLIFQIPAQDEKRPVKQIIETKGAVYR